MPKSFAREIRPLFRDKPDVDAMKGFGIDLSSYQDVSARAAEILARLEDGSMPCDGPWPKDRIQLFKRWIEEGMAP